jgi:hypothetical protein
MDRRSIFASPGTSYHASYVAWTLSGVCLEIANLLHSCEGLLQVRPALRLLVRELDK